MQKFNEQQIQQSLQNLPGWSYSDGSVRRTFEFADFNEAFGFMARAALVAEAMNHHPDWSNVYKTVSVSLSTHDAGGVTQRDIDLASRMDQIADR